MTLHVMLVFGAIFILGCWTIQSSRTGGDSPDKKKQLLKNLILTENIWQSWFKSFFVHHDDVRKHVSDVQAVVAIDTLWNVNESKWLVQEAAAVT